MTDLLKVCSEFFKQYGRLLYDAIRSVDREEIPKLLAILSYENDMQGLVERIGELEAEIQRQKRAA